MLNYKINSIAEINSTMITWIAVLVFWELIWKSLALWKAARSGSKAWFIAILIINSVGILPIVYLLANKQSDQSEK